MKNEARTVVDLPGDPAPKPEPQNGQAPADRPPQSVAAEPPAAAPAVAVAIPGSPFQVLEPRQRRLKLFVFGGSGVGKTVFGMQFPSAAYIDMERGTEAYQEEAALHVQQTTSCESVMQAVDWLRSHEHPYATLVIDPITIFWEDLQRKWSDIFLRRNTRGAGHRGEFYDMQPGDWQTVKSELRSFMRKLLALDMNVIVTAREKDRYRQSGFMEVEGVTFDAEKSMPYLFDVVLQLYRGENGEYLARTLKARGPAGQKLPAEGPMSFESLAAIYGRDVLTRVGTPVELASAEQQERIRAALAELGAPPEAVRARLAEYDAASIEELSAQHAATIIERLESASAEAQA